MICRDAAEAISQSLDAPLSAVERIDLAIHALFCGPCRRFRKQLARLHTDCATTARDEPPTGTELSAAARARIATALDNPPAD